MTDHPQRARVAEVMVVRGGPSGATVATRGSGYLVSAGWVLTAAHVVRQATSISVWLGAPARLDPEAGVAVDVQRVLAAPGADLALLPVARHAAAGPLTEPALLGRLGRDPGPPTPAAAAGCPRFKLRPAAGQDGPLLRELAYAVGGIAGLSDAKTGRFAFAVDGAPAPDPRPDEHSPWEGMSGAAVWVNNRLIGVVGEHHPREGTATLTVCPVEPLPGTLPEDQLRAWRTALPQLPATGKDLRPATPPTPGSIDLARARRVVQGLAPRVLIGRGAELAELAAFPGSGGQWRWIQAAAFAGKTALLAWFGLYPPEHVDVVSCFLRRAAGENTSEYAVDVLTRQLALLADRRDFRPSASVSERNNDLLDLLEEAAHAGAERGRRLLMLVDGLDEYDPAAALALATLLPGAGTLPGAASLLVASRAGADVALPPTHPLCANVRHIAASEAAAEIRYAAQAELERVLRDRNDFLFPVVSCLAVAGSGLTSAELRALLRRRGRDADIAEIEALLDGSVRRSLTRQHDGDGGQVYIFAHETLLAEARLRLAGDRAAYEELVDAWAREYAQRAWPVDSPRYLGRPYTRELGRRARDPESPPDRRDAAAARLLDLAVDPDRRGWLRKRLGNDLTAVSEIEEAEYLNRSAGRPDLGRAVRLAMSRDALRDRGGSPSAPALTVLARVDWRRAAKLAAVAGDGSVAALAGELVRTAADDLEPAASVGHLIESPANAVPVLCELASAYHDRGRRAPARATAEEALAAAYKIMDVSARATGLCQVASVLTALGHPSAAADTLAVATEAADHIAKDDGSRAACLMRIATSLDAAGKPESARSAAKRALDIARGARDTARAAELMTTIAASDPAGLISQQDRAVALSEVRRRATEGTFPYFTDEPRALAALSLAQVYWALPHEAALKKAMELADQVEDPEFHAKILKACATVLALVGETDRASGVLEEAVDVASSSRWDEYTWWRRDDTLRDLAMTQVRHGFHRAARETVTTRMAHWKEGALAAIADTQVDAGDLAEAAATVQLISDPDVGLPASGRLACALAKSRNPLAPSALDDLVATINASDGDRDLRAGLGYAAVTANYLGRPERAQELAERSLTARRPKTPEEHVDILLGIGRAHAAVHDTEKATRCLTEAMRRALSLDAGDDPFAQKANDQAIVAIALAQAGLGQYAAALAGLANLRASLWPDWEAGPEAYAAIASLQARAGRTTDADSTFALAVAAVLPRYDPLQEHRTGYLIKSIVLAQARSGRQLAAWATAEQLRAVELNGYWGRSRNADICLAKLAEYYISTGCHGDARKTVERIRDDQVRRETEAALAAPSAGPLDEAEGWESRARALLAQWETRTTISDAPRHTRDDILQLAEAATTHGSRALATRLITVALALMPCHQVLAAACRVDRSFGALLAEYEPLPG